MPRYPITRANAQSLTCEAPCVKWSPCDKERGSFENPPRNGRGRALVIFLALMSTLEFDFGTTRMGLTLPFEPSYVGLVELWARHGPAPWIGIQWRSTPKHAQNTQRSDQTGGIFRQCWADSALM